MRAILFLFRLFVRCPTTDLSIRRIIPREFLPLPASCVRAVSPRGEVSVSPFVRSLVPGEVIFPVGDLFGCSGIVLCATVITMAWKRSNVKRYLLTMLWDYRERIMLACWGNRTYVRTDKPLSIARFSPPKIPGQQLGGPNVDCTHCPRRATPTPEATPCGPLSSTGAPGR